MKTNVLSGASAIALIVALGVAPTAFAQENVDQIVPQNDTAAQSSGERVIVTGSRIAVETGEDSPVPATVLGVEEFQNSAQSNIADVLLEIPALRSSATGSKGNNGINSGSYLNLRGIGAFRNLVLLDGKRFVSTTQFSGGGPANAVNIDAFPSGLIARVDTVTGGASAAYGSDAVAGVVNFILDTDFDGIKGEAQIGQSDYGDNLNYKAQITAGGVFGADSRGHILFNAEFGRSEGILGDPFGANPNRPWQDEVPAFASAGGEFGLIQNSRYAGTPPQGVIWTGPLRGTTFNPDGTPRPYDFGANLRGDWASGGEGWKLGGASMLSAPSIRSSLFARVSYDLNDDTNVYFEALRSQNSGKGHQGHIGPDILTGTAGIAITRDNAYITPELGAAMDAAGVDTVSIRKIFNNVDNRIKNNLDRVMFGIDGRINDDWVWDAYYSYGASNGSFTFAGDNPLADSFFYATDAVFDADDNIICRIQLTDPNHPCVPYNLMGTTDVTAAQRNYLFPEPTYLIENTQEVVESSVSGSLFELPAGTVSLAAGVGYRHESLDRSTDSLGASGRTNPYTGTLGVLGYLNQPAIQGAYELWEGFGEIQVPLLTDVPLVRSLDLNLATRYTDYSTSGGVNTWKAGLVYEPFDGLRLRGTLSRDIRAANLVELFSPEASSYGTVRDPFNNDEFVAIIPLIAGNTDLQPEEADTTTFGAVYRPSFLPDFFVSADYYDIQIAGQISTLSTQRTVDLCFEGVQSYCGFITRSPTTDLILSVQTPFLNLSQYKTSGIDVEAGFDHPLDLFGAPGDLSLRLFATHIIESTTTAAGAGAIPQDTADTVGREVGNLTATYKTGPWSFTLQEGYVSGGRINVSLPRFDGDRIGSQTWTDVSGRYQFDNGVEIFGSVQNLFDQDPPIVPLLGPVSTPWNTAFDILGRRYVLGVRFEL